MGGLNRELSWARRMLADAEQSGDTVRVSYWGGVVAGMLHARVASR